MTTPPTPTHAELLNENAELRRQIADWKKRSRGWESRAKDSHLKLTRIANEIAGNHDNH